MLAISTSPNRRVIYMSEDKSIQEETKKKSLTKEERYVRLISQLQNISRKLMNMSESHRQAAYWEQIIEDCDDLLKRSPLA